VTSGRSQCASESQDAPGMKGCSQPACGHWIGENIISIFRVKRRLKIKNKYWLVVTTELSAARPNMNVG